VDLTASDGLAGQSLDKNRFGDGGECTAILKLFAGGFNFESDGIASQYLDKNRFEDEASVHPSSSCFPANMRSCVFELVKLVQRRMTILELFASRFDFESDGPAAQGLHENQFGDGGSGTTVLELLPGIGLDHG